MVAILSYTCVCMECKISFHFFSGSKKVTRPHLASSRVPDTSGPGSGTWGHSLSVDSQKLLSTTAIFLKVGETRPFPTAICFNDPELCQYLHMRTAGPAILGQHAQGLFGFSTCKRKDLSRSSGLPSAHQTEWVSPLWP